MKSHSRVVCDYKKNYENLDFGKNDLRLLIIKRALKKYLQTFSITRLEHS